LVTGRDPVELPAARRAVAIGTFDGMHRGHRTVIESLRETGLRSTVVTFTPHPREVLGGGIQLLASLERRLELFEEAEVDDVLLVDFTPDLARLAPEEFVRTILVPLGTEVVRVGESFRFGRGRAGDVELLRELGFDVRPVPIVAGVSSTRIRDFISQGDMAAAAQLLGRPPEIEGLVVAGDQRGGTLGYPTANLAVAPNLLVPAFGIYAGEVDLAPQGAAPDRRRIALSVGVNPHYGGHERRVEAFLLDYHGDLYGRHLRLELWARLREERVFDSEAALVEQIGRDVEQARAASRPV
jgi:riboflavin kinase/FMN adenylyltransferase